MDLELPLSRPRETAARLGDLAPDRHRFTGKRVLLTGEKDSLTTRNGQDAFIGSLLLLVRICPNVTVVLPPGLSALVETCENTAARIAFGPPVTTMVGEAPLREFDAILSIGPHVRADLPWTAINSNGWLARVSSGHRELSTSCHQENPIGAFAASCLGVTEVFKRLISLREIRGRPLDGVTFSLFSYGVMQEDPGPILPEILDMHIGLAGVGAIGNGVVHLLSLLPVRGRLLVTDKQEYGPENLGTCCLIGPKDLQTYKSDFAKKILGTKLDTVASRGDVSDLQNILGVDQAYPPVFINGLDNIPARHAIQDMWPDLIVDGAIGDFTAQASRHPWGENIACLRCLFREVAPTVPADQFASDVTGLSKESVRDPERLVTQADLEDAPPERRDQLKRYLGRQICSVVQEELARQIADSRQAEGFEPSVPFVAGLSASMVVAEVVKYVGGWHSTLEPRIQLDVLRGPVQAQSFPEERRAECLCSSRASVIEAWRMSRADFGPSRQ